MWRKIFHHNHEHPAIMLCMRAGILIATRNVRVVRVSFASFVLVLKKIFHKLNAFLDEVAAGDNIKRARNRNRAKGAGVRAHLVN